MTEALTAADGEEDIATRIAGAPSGKGVARVDSRMRVTVGERITLAVDIDRLHFFDPRTGRALAREEGPRRDVPT